MQVNNNGRPAALMVLVGGDVLEGLVARGEARAPRVGKDAIAAIRRVEPSLNTDALVKDSRGR